jgi:hypothetical protein
MPIRKYLSERSKEAIWLVAPPVGQSIVIALKVRRPEVEDEFNRPSMVPIAY